MRKVLITGANGFLGSEVVRQAMRDGLSVVATDRETDSKISGVNYVSGDILDTASSRKMVDGIDCVCHVAGLAHIFYRSDSISRQFHAVNVTGAENVARSAIEAGVAKILLISSVSVYGGESYGKDETFRCSPDGAYAESKFRAEQSLAELCQNAGVNLTILRLATLYGENDPGNVARLIRSIHDNRFVWIGTGDNQKSLLHRQDAARAVVTVIKSLLPGVNTYNVAGCPSKMRDIVAVIERALQRRVTSFRLPAGLVLNSLLWLKLLSWNNRRISGLYSTLEKWLANDYYNAEKFNDTFNFNTAVTLNEGIEREVGWFMRSHVNKL